MESINQTIAIARRTHTAALRWIKSLPWDSRHQYRNWYIVISLIAALLIAVSSESFADEDKSAAGRRIHRSIPPPGAKTHTVVPGERFKTGWFRRWLYGSDYRHLWTTPIEVAVLDLDSVGGGLTPLRTGGFGQSISLHFTGEDGQRYTVRSLDKDPTKRLDKLLKNTFVENIIQDMISAQLPTAGLVVDPLMEATGILHSPHTLVVIPDHPNLGEYRKQFAGLIGTLQQKPSEGPNDTPGFAGSDKISGTDKLWKHLEKSPRNRVDSRAFLKAKFIDFLVGDKDRHAGQWTWARFPDGDGYRWVPIPEDRDQAFVDFDGLVMAIVRRAAFKYVKFEKSLPSYKGLSRNGWEIDREFLAELEKPVWDSLVTAFQSELPDHVIEDAARRLPQPYYDMVGPSLAGALKSRRDKLPEFVSNYYRFISHDVEITATDKDEYVEVEHLPDGDLAVRIGQAGGSGINSATPYFQRTFHPDETNEVRMYLHGGDDQVKVLGEKAKITLRIDGGGGDDSYSNQSQASAGKTRFYDSRGENQFDKGNGAKIDTRPYKRPAPAGATVDRYTLDWGSHTITFPQVSASPDLGVYAGIVGVKQYYGYRKDPFASRHAIRLGLASNGPEPFVSYKGHFRHLWPNVDGIIYLEYSGINMLRYHGLGNDTEIPESSSFYEVEQSEFTFAPAFQFEAGENRGQKEETARVVLRPTFSANIGPILRYSDTPMSDNEDYYIATLDPLPYGFESFGQAGMRGSLKYDTRDNPAFTQSGVLINASGVVYPEVWDVESTFGHAEGSASTYLTARIPTEPTLALRAGGKKVWGTYPFHNAAYVGGPSDLRGFRENRFAGDAAVYGNAELRFALTKIRLLVPGELGLFGAADAGRVFLDEDPDDADEWHTSVGGGVWLSFLRRKQTLSVAIMQGDDMTGVYFGAGFMF